MAPNFIHPAVEPIGYQVIGQHGGWPGDDHETKQDQQVLAHLTPLEFVEG